jgi:hypothetical protein
MEHDQFCGTHKSANPSLDGPCLNGASMTATAGNSRYQKRCGDDNDDGAAHDGNDISSSDDDDDDCNNTDNEDGDNDTKDFPRDVSHPPSSLHM